MRKSLVILCSLFAGGALLAGCGGDEDPTPVAVVLTQAAGGGDLTLSGPDTVKSGAVEIRFQNQAQGPADAALIGVQGTHTGDEVLEVLSNQGGPIPPWIKFNGGTGTTPPGQTATATVELDEGSYYLQSAVESEDDGPPTTASKALRVSGKGGGSVPKGDVTITATDYAFDVGTLKAGANEIRFENKGKQVHHLQAFPINPGRSIGDVRTAFEAEGETEGPPPVDFAGNVGTAAVDQDQALVTTINLNAGKYAFVCFISDREGGPSHYTKGMLQEVTVA